MAELVKDDEPRRRSKESKTTSLNEEELTKQWRGNSAPWTLCTRLQPLFFFEKKTRSENLSENRKKNKDPGQYQTCELLPILVKTHLTASTRRTQRRLLQVQLLRSKIVEIGIPANAIRGFGADGFDVLEETTAGTLVPHSFRIVSKPTPATIDYLDRCGTSIRRENPDSEARAAREMEVRERPRRRVPTRCPTHVTQCPSGAGANAFHASHLRQVSSTHPLLLCPR